MVKISIELAKYFEDNGFSQKEVADKMGTSSAYINAICNGRKAIGKKQAEKMENLFGLSKSWLLTGEGNMLIRDVRTTSAKKMPSDNSVPFFGDMPVSAGTSDLAVVLGGQQPTGWISIPGMPKSIGAFPVVGCSMEPEIRQGDFVAITLIDKWELVDPDKIYMIITHEERMIKRLAIDNENGDILWCISPNYKDFKLYKSDIIAIYRITFYGRIV